LADSNVCLNASAVEIFGFDDVAWSQLVLLGKVVHHNPRQDDHIGALAVEDALLLDCGEVITDCQRVARRAQ
jgi:hypothetical protein